MICIYVAGAMNADNIQDVFSNIRRGQELTDTVREMGFSPYPTFENYQWSLRANIPNSDFYEMDLAQLVRQDVMVVVRENWEGSKGVKIEIEAAKENKIPVFFSDQLQELEYWKIAFESQLPIPCRRDRPTQPIDTGDNGCLPGWNRGEFE